MLHHIVMFQFRSDVTPELREQAASRFKQGIEALPSIIPNIDSVHVGINCNPAEKWDICLTSTFATFEHLTHYATHPAHKALAGALMQHIAQRACVDFEQ